ncbi:MAG: DMT family transporter [Chitinophagales bacterium]
MITSVFLFGFMNVFVKMLNRIPSHEVVLFRSAITLVITFYLLRKKRIHPLGKTHRWIMIGRGVAGSISLLVFFYTLKHMPLATSVTIAYLSPIFTIIFASFLLKEHIHWQQWVFFAFSFGGIILINGVDKNTDTSLVLLGLFGAACSGLAYNALRKTGNKVDALVLVFYLPLITIPVVTPFCINNWVTPNWEELLLLFGVGLVTQVAQLYMTKAYQMEKAGSISNYVYLGIVFALFFGFLFFHERFDLLAIVGMVIVVAGIIANFFYVNRVTSLKRFMAYFRGIPGM